LVPGEAPHCAPKQLGSREKIKAENKRYQQ
jgi:hypothetical protein